MKKFRINEGDIVRVDWLDHFSQAAGWKNLDKVLNKIFVMPTCTSTGLVVCANKDIVVLAQNWHPSIEATDPWKVADFMIILRPVIKNVIVYKKKEVEII